MQKMELRYWWEYGDEKTRIDEWKALVDWVSGEGGEGRVVCDTVGSL